MNAANAFKERNYPGETLDVTKVFDEMNYSKGSKDQPFDVVAAFN